MGVVKIQAVMVVAAAAMLALAASACGGGGDNRAAATPDASGMIEITARDVKFVPDRITVPAGQEVTLVLKNEDPQQHDLQVTDLEVEVMEGGATGAEHEMETPLDDTEEGMETAEPSGHGEQPSGEMGPIAVHTTANGEASITFIATEKGTYEFRCTITGHKEAGMVGELTVE